MYSESSSGFAEALEAWLDLGNTTGFSVLVGQPASDTAAPSGGYLSPDQLSEMYEVIYEALRYVATVKSECCVLISNSCAQTIVSRNPCSFALRETRWDDIFVWPPLTCRFVVVIVVFLVCKEKGAHRIMLWDASEDQVNVTVTVDSDYASKVISTCIYWLNPLPDISVLHSTYSETFPCVNLM